MIEFEEVAGTQGWFQEKGNSYDVIISSRARISRNLSGYKFPVLLKSDNESSIQSEILTAFSLKQNGYQFQHTLIGDIPTIERRMLLERNFISQHFSLQNHKAFIKSGDHKITAMVNEVDHIRLSCINGGLCLKECWSHVDEVDIFLERNLDYAVSLEWGYLNAEVTNIGTGLRASVLAHLPALVATALIDKAMKAVVQMGMTVKGFFGDDENSLGDMYQISNQFTLGLSETDLMEKLDVVASQLVHYERKARQELLDKQRIETEDRVMRALGTLTFCRTISVQEAIGYLSVLRMGVSLGIADLPLELLTALLFLTQKAHVQHKIGSQKANADTKTIDHTRAEIIRFALANDLKTGGNNV